MNLGETKIDITFKTGRSSSAGCSITLPDKYARELESILESVVGYEIIGTKSTMANERYNEWKVAVCEGQTVLGFNEWCNG